MATDPGFLTFARDLFAPLGPISTKRMFGGTGLYIGDAMFAALLGDTIYMKAEGPLVAAYQAAGSEPFSYGTKAGRRAIPGLTSLPDSALDDPDEALDWARKSLADAETAAARKRARRR
ncbi:MULTISPECIES: TfoX/Sxy family protein [Actibacterium]|uniref:DNA transformation protein n=1 Tax=Actibacterium naphthalenivorans TaxID=1614693 RepID=A0A840CKC1_9RHOB|nr:MULTISPECIES: TfoX/Sxy family protein [Actibacterium]MBB4023196.1 DNA transformation protein [Actibacterium naphthalenivorans]